MDVSEWVDFDVISANHVVFLIIDVYMLKIWRKEHSQMSGFRSIFFSLSDSLEYDGFSVKKCARKIKLGIGVLLKHESTSPASSMLDHVGVT